jgi:hypothetical protein
MVTYDDHAVGTETSGDGAGVSRLGDLSAEEAVTPDTGQQVVLPHVEDLRRAGEAGRALVRPCRQR